MGERVCGKTPINCRYYNDVTSCRTTTSCSGFRPCWSSRLISPHLVVPLVLVCSLAGAYLLGGAAIANENKTKLAPLFPLEPTWTTTLDRPPATGPAYDTTHAYVPLRNGTLAAVSLLDGTVSWSLIQKTNFTPTAGDKLLVVTEGNTLIGLRTTDGHTLWKADMGAPVSAQPILATGWLIVTLETGELVALRGLDGQEIWRVALEGSLSVRPSISGGQLFVPIEDGRILAIELATGSTLWEHTIGGSPREILPLDALFVGSTDNYFYRLSIATGAVEWRWRNGGDVVGAPTVDEERVYFLALDNILRSLDRQSGVQQWRQLLITRPTSGPVNFGSFTFVSGVSPSILAFNMIDGSLAGRYEAPAELAAAPHVLTELTTVNPLVVILTGDGRLIGLQRASLPTQFALEFPPAPLRPAPKRCCRYDALSFTPLPSFEFLLLSRSYPPTTPYESAAPAATDQTLASTGQTSVAATEVSAGKSVTKWFAVQVVALQNEASAVTLANFLIERGFEAYVVGPSANSAHQLHRVLVGRLLTSLEAEKLAERIAREEALDTVIVQIP